MLPQAVYEVAIDLVAVTLVTMLAGYFAMRHFPLPDPQRRIGCVDGLRGYLALAVLFALLTVVLLPTGAVQLAISREVSRRHAVGDEIGADAFEGSVKIAFELAYLRQNAVDVGPAALL